MTSCQIPGVRFRPVEFTPASSNFSGKKIQGIGIELTDRENFSATKLGAELALGLAKLYPGRMNWDLNRRLIGSGLVVAAFASGSSFHRRINRRLRSGVAQFLELLAEIPALSTRYFCKIKQTAKRTPLLRRPL